MSGTVRPWEFNVGQRVYSVAEFTAELKDLLQDEFPDIKISGEISGARRYPSGHWYFTLKDSKAQISCVCFRREARYLRTEPQHGMEVVARGRVSVFAKQGKYQFYVKALEPRGLGKLQAEYERLKKKLEAEGLFDEGRKRKLPPLPQRIGIVTSPKGAVIADMLRVLGRRFPGLRIKLFPVAVQGRTAGTEIAKGVRYFSDRPWADVVIVGRGGGSLEDLWAFNEEVVARAIAASSVPVVSAVGHQTDFTISDFVADLRAATPSAAAELVVPQALGIAQLLIETEQRASTAMSLRLERLKTRMLQASMERAARLVGRKVDAAWQDLETVADSLIEIQLERSASARERLDHTERRLKDLDLRLRLARQAEGLSSASQRLQPAMTRRLDLAGAGLSSATQRLVPAVRRKLDLAGARIESLEGGLRALSPIAILERGYAIVRTRDGTPVRETGQVAPGDLVGVTLHRGRLTARVEHVEE